MARGLNPYAGFNVELGMFTFHASPSHLSVFRDGELVDGPHRIGYVPRTREQLMDIGFAWLREKCGR